MQMHFEAIRRYRMEGVGKRIQQNLLIHLMLMDKGSAAIGRDYACLLSGIRLAHPKFVIVYNTDRR